jgi:PAS domain S-box-containing protein
MVMAGLQVEHMAEQDRMTAALLAAIAHSTEPMVLSDARLPDTPMIAVNAAFEALSGYPRIELVGRNCRLLQGAGTDQATRARIGRCVRAGEGCIEWIVNYRKDGTAFWNLLFISPVFGPDGTLRHHLGNQLDITKGLPDWLGEVTFGRAHMSHEVQAEFQSLLQEILRNTDTVVSNSALALERIIAAARRLSELTTQLEPGRLIPPPGSPPLPASLTSAVPARNGRAGPAAL